MDRLWTEQLSVGNAQMDSEHRHIAQMVNGVEQAVIAMDHAGLLHSLKLLLDSMHIHFKNEELIARAVGFPFGEHSLSHQYMLKKLQHIKNGLDAGSELQSAGMVEDFINLLRGWLVDHVMKEDMLMKPVLETHFYNFKTELPE